MEHQRGAGSRIKAECEDGRQDGKARHHGRTGVQQGGQAGRVQDVLLFAQIGAVNDHAGTGHRQRKERLPHGHDPSVQIRKVGPVGDEQIPVAVQCAGQEGYAHGNDQEQQKKGRHHHLVDLFNPR